MDESTKQLVEDLTLLKDGLGRGGFKLSSDLLEEAIDKILELTKPVELLN